jgi:3-hydroxy-9,10-secoandrosta-1,3,5(10)-triene-9,17-dione monooxygenase
METALEQVTPADGQALTTSQVPLERTVFKTHQSAVAAARALAPAIRARSARTEADRQVPVETIDALKESGLFGVIAPKVFGGSELGFETLAAVTAEIAAACGSSGWVYGVLAGHSWMLNAFPAEAQREVFAKERVLIATVFRLAGTAKSVDGGYRLAGGEGRFCSGIDHADWVIVGSAVEQAGGAPEPRFFVVPRAEVEIIDDWFTAGMRGTGSKSIRIIDSFIPAHRSVALVDLVSGQRHDAPLATSPLYRMPFHGVTPFSLVGAPLGMARSALTIFRDALAERVGSMAEEQAAEQSATFARLAEAAAQIDAACALVMSDARSVDSASDPSELTPLDWSRIARDWAYAVQQARYATTRLFEAAGGSGIYNSSDLQRVWRDVNAAAQHFAFTLDSSMTSYGRALLGLPASRFGPKGR